MCLNKLTSVSLHLSDCWECCWCSTTGDMFSQQFDDMLGLLQSLEARLTDLHGKSVSMLVLFCFFCFQITHKLSY